MTSLIQIKNKLPMDFIEELYKTYNVRIADKILMKKKKKRLTTLRVNTLRYNIENLIQYFQEKNIEYEKVPWYNNALIIKNIEEKEFKELDIYKNGYIYLQSLSSMIPALVLDPKKGEKVLDLTAAPGSKTTQMSAIMKNEGYILANELDKIRCERLKYNINMQGAKIVEVINGKGEEIGEKYPNTFDKILLDTPCSGEGRFSILDTNTYKNWSTKQVSELVKIQKQLLESAVKALKQNGIMVYSTCTLNKKENEEILNWGIENLNIEILDIDLKLKDSIKGNAKGLDKLVEKSLKVLPNKEQEGFFIAKIIRK